MSSLQIRAGRPLRKTTMLAGAVLSLSLLAACNENGQFSLEGLGASKATTAGSTKSTKLVERDVEAPAVFNVTDQGLWDGRPSLGGVWVAHPDVTEPERVIIRNTANGKFVIGALFRRERDLPGPNLQISSDAAATLNVLAGAPAPLNVTALRREETPGEEDATAAATGAAETLSAPSEVSKSSLDPIAVASAAIDKAPATPVSAPAATPKPQATNLSKPFVQIGIFSIEANATRSASQMRTAGLVPTIKKSQIKGKEFWRVVVGPAQNRSQLNSITKTIKAEGFSDAYAVTN